MLHVRRCNVAGGTEGVSGSNRLPNRSSAGLTGENIMRKNLGRMTRQYWHLPTNSLHHR